MKIVGLNIDKGRVAASVIGTGMRQADFKDSFTRTFATDAELVDILKEKASEWAGARIVSAIPGRHFSQRIVHFPFVDRKRIEKALPFEIEDSVPFPLDDVEIDHNTFVPTNYLSFVMSGLKGHDDSGKVIGIPCRRFKLTNNIMGFGQYGVAVDGGQNTFAEAFPAATCEKNLLVGHGEGRAEHAVKNKNFPAGFLFEPKHVGNNPQDDADWPAVGFANSAAGDYRLTAASKYRAMGTGGRALGADVDAIEGAVKRAK